MGSCNNDGIGLGCSSNGNDVGRSGIDSGKGTLFGVSVGPGDPELMTLKAKRIIEQCPCIAAPVTKSGNSLALSIAKGAVNMDGKTIIELKFPMSTDPQVLAENRQQQARQIASQLELGNDVAMLNLGDISVFSTFGYMRELLGEAYSVQAVAGVTSFCASAARLGISLTEPDQPLHIIPAGEMDIDAALELDGCKVLMKSGSHLKDTIGKIKAHGLEQQSHLVQNCGLENEAVFYNIDDANIGDSYFTTIIVS